jgi:hypothetical protein
MASQEQDSLCVAGVVEKGVRAPAFAASMSASHLTGRAIERARVWGRCEPRFVDRHLRARALVA